jgi:hypothetical protein
MWHWFKDLCTGFLQGLPDIGAGPGQIQPQFRMPVEIILPACQLAVSCICLHKFDVFLSDSFIFLQKQ